MCAFVDARVPFVVLLDNSAKKDLESADLHLQITRGLETKSRLSMQNLKHLWVGYTKYERNMCTTGLSTSYMWLPADSKVTALQLAVRQEPVVQRRHNTKINTDAYQFHVKKCYLRDAPDSRANSFTDQAKLTRQTTQVGVFVNADCRIVAGEKLCYVEGLWWAEELPKKGSLWSLPAFADIDQDHTHYPLHLEGVPEVEGMRLIINRTCPVSKINDYHFFRQLLGPPEPLHVAQPFSIHYLAVGVHEDSDLRSLARELRLVRERVGTAIGGITEIAFLNVELVGVGVDHGVVATLNHRFLPHSKLQRCHLGVRGQLHVGSGEPSGAHVALVVGVSDPQVLQVLH